MEAAKETPRVWNRRDPQCPPGAVYVGRPSRYGNPFRLRRESERAEVLARYREHLEGRADLAEILAELRGRDLVCWCAPKSCHADVLLELANARDAAARARGEEPS